MSRRKVSEAPSQKSVVFEESSPRGHATGTEESGKDSTLDPEAGDDEIDEEMERPKVVKSKIVDENNVWGEVNRRHFSLQARGRSIQKISHDFSPSTALAKLSVFHTFSCDILVHKVMRTTFIGLAMTAISMDTPWQVPLLIRSAELQRKEKLDKLLEELSILKQEEQQRVGISIKGEKRDLAKEFRLRDRRRDMDLKVRQAEKDHAEIVHERSTCELRLSDRFGPKIWFLTQDGCLFEGCERVADTGQHFNDGDTVTMELEAGWLKFSINGQPVNGSFKTKIEMRTAVAVYMENKGAHLELVRTSLDDFAQEMEEGVGLEQGLSDQAYDEIHDAAQQPHGALLKQKSSVKALVKESQKGEGSQDGDHDGIQFMSQSQLQQIVADLASELQSRWEHVDAAFRSIDLNGDGLISKREFRQVMVECGLSAMMGKNLDRIWTYLDSDGSGAMSYSEFLKRVCFSGGGAASGVAWGIVAEGVVVDGQKATNTTMFGRSALLAHTITSGKMSVELELHKVSGTLFLGAMQVQRKVLIRKGQVIAEYTTMPLDVHWFFEAEECALQTWYLSDVGVIRNGGNTLAHIETELKTGDVVGLEIDMTHGTMSFVVNGKAVAEDVQGLSGDIQPAVFIAGDEGDSVIIRKVTVKVEAESLEQVMRRRKVSLAHINVPETQMKSIRAHQRKQLDEEVQHVVSTAAHKLHDYTESGSRVPERTATEYDEYDDDSQAEEEDGFNGL